MANIQKNRELMLEQIKNLRSEQTGRLKKQPKMSARLQELINKGWVLSEDEGTVKNPETGREIKVSSALSYDPSHPAHQAAKKAIDKETPNEVDDEIPSQYKEIPPYSPEKLQAMVTQRIRDNELYNERDIEYEMMGHGPAKYRPTDPEGVAKEIEANRESENERRMVAREKWADEKQKKEREEKEKERKEREEQERIKNQTLPPTTWDLIDQGYYGPGRIN